MELLVRQRGKLNGWASMLKPLCKPCDSTYSSDAVAMMLQCSPAVTLHVAYLKKEKKTQKKSPQTSHIDKNGQQ